MRTVVFDAVNLPAILYGTAWKEDETRRLVSLALARGFRGIDTANQAKHYHEAQVGEALAEAFAQGLSRDEVFLQTKFTFQGGQDHRLPYDPKARIAEQVRQSFARSLEHLQTQWLDSYLLHGPSQRSGLGADDWEAWRAMESLPARALGISNVSLQQLQELLEGARVKPAFVQNRCYASRGWDADVRAFCLKHGIVYQGFSLLTANADAVSGSAIRQAALRVRRTPQQVVFRFAMQVGMLPLTGTTDPRHMEADLAVEAFTLTDAEVEAIERG